MAVKISDIVHFLSQLAPPSLQETYDNAGLIVGNAQHNCTGIVVCLDSIEEVLDEAIEKNCNLIIAHHPIVFSGIKKFNGKNYIERIIIKAIKNDIAIFAIHTNLDNVLDGVNGKMAQHLRLINCSVLAPKGEIYRKLHVYVPLSHTEKVQQALFDAGAGTIGNYDQCSFLTEGKGTYRPNSDAQPFVGNKGTLHIEKEQKIEVIYPVFNEQKILKAMKNAHPYEEVAYDSFDIHHYNKQIGAGVIGDLTKEVPLMDFLTNVKTLFNVGSLKYTTPIKDTVKRIAFCGGSGSFLLNEAKSQQADVFISSDFKYHQFFDADKSIVIADIGHYESEFLTINLLVDRLKEKFTTFAVLLTNVNTNPINFL